MQILFKYSFLLKVNMAWLEKKSYLLNKANFCMILLLLISHGKSYVVYFLDFPNSLCFPSVSVYSVKPLTQLLLPFPQLDHTWSAPSGVEKVNSAIMTFCLVCTVLALARIEVILVRMVLSFGFVTKTVLITQGCFSRCWTVLLQHQDLFCFLCWPASK